jgi:hypothetical protein
VLACGATLTYIGLTSVCRGAPQIDLKLLKKLSLSELRVATEIPIGLCVEVLEASQTMKFESLEDIYSVPDNKAMPSSSVLKTLVGYEFKADKEAAEAAQKSALAKKKAAEATGTAQETIETRRISEDQTEEYKEDEQGAGLGFGKFGRK